MDATKDMEIAKRANVEDLNKAASAHFEKELTTKSIGIIKSVKFGGERPFGLHLDIKLENGNGVGWVITKDLERIYQFCKDARVEYINELLEKPVECIFEGDGGAGCKIIECRITKQML